jgi:hypothetical protein
MVASVVALPLSSLTKERCYLAGALMAALIDLIQLGSRFLKHGLQLLLMAHQMEDETAAVTIRFASVSVTLPLAP